MEALKQSLDLEKSMPVGLSQNMPFHYVEIAHVLFNKASDNVPDADRARMLIEDIQDVRMSKLRSGVNIVLKQAVSEGTTAGAKMTGASHMELNTIRRMYVVLGVFNVFAPVAAAQHTHTHTHTHACLSILNLSTHMKLRLCFLHLCKILTRSSHSFLIHSAITNELSVLPLA